MMLITTYLCFPICFLLHITETLTRKMYFFLTPENSKILEGGFDS
ncbi:uncharacterized protein METZ01_LOCUS247091 [marine metagenome]|uniref:Uncharacterized protein n=1 Tax=marine metagenome TaxID=408172 RepID=A0A382I4V1_9ZZZZ